MKISDNSKMSNLITIDYETLEPIAISYFEKRNGSGNNDGSTWAAALNSHVDSFINDYSKKYKLNRKDVIKAYLTRMTRVSGSALCCNHFASAMLTIIQTDEKQTIPYDKLEQQCKTLNSQVLELSKSVTEQQNKQNELEQTISKIKANETKLKCDDELLELNIKNISKYLTRKVKTLFSSFDSFTTKYVIISMLLFVVLLLMNISNNSFTSFISLALIMCVLNIITQFKVDETTDEEEDVEYE